ncbi:MAG TPA: glycine/sarcosine/betaine reductase selenoprotein B family protein [Tissierellaceae bacterium]|nr:glycine/sarcosine/betaine reductase selenoprotein B family protein [Tissierellaceae bacterium]
MTKISFKQRIIGKIAEYMVASIDSKPYIAEVKKELKDSRIAFITTAGVHLKNDKPFDTNGDHSFRIIPGDVDFNDLTITHNHYDKEEALKDINCVFPLEILRNLQAEGFIKEVAPRHFGLMGYIPNMDLLINDSAPKIADILVKDEVDMVLLSPG